MAECIKDPKKLFRDGTRYDATWENHNYLKLPPRLASNHTGISRNGNRAVIFSPAIAWSLKGWEFGNIVQDMGLAGGFGV